MPEVWKNPYVIGGAAVAFVALVALSARSGGSGANAASVATLASSNAVNAQLAGLTTQQNIETIHANMAETINAQNVRGSLAGGLTAGILSFLKSSGDNQTARDLQAAQIAGGIKLTQINNAFAAELDPKMAQIYADSAKALTEIKAQNNVDLANINAGLQENLYSQFAQLDFGKTVIKANTAKEIANAGFDPGPAIFGTLNNVLSQNSPQAIGNAVGGGQGFAGILSGIMSIFG